MGNLNFMLACAAMAFLLAALALPSRVKIPRTRFTCTGRPSGYYADIETGCQVYHMCDELGRQFSYSCPNTTLFQQRMLVCDHWYMVNCSMAERDYDANLLIGQRDKPFVTDADMRLRTPRPDILSVPPNHNYYDGIREAETSFAIHPGNSIVGIADSISSVNNNDLDSGKRNYRPPTSWSTGIGQTQRKPINSFNSKIDTNVGVTSEDNLAGAASQGIKPAFGPTTNSLPQGPANVKPPSKELIPPFTPAPTAESRSDDFDIDVRAKNTNDAIFNFIKRFDPNSPDSIKTSRTKTEILDLNKHLPEGQVSSEEDRTPRKNKNFGNTGNNFNILQGDKKKGISDESRVDKINVKSTNVNEDGSSTSINQVPVPDKHLLPPKTDYLQIVTTTMGPPVYYEWKWAVPAFDLLPPKEGSPNNDTEVPKVKPYGKRPFSVVPRSTPKIETLSPTNTEYNISSYFVPDYVFPLDGAHPGYEEDDAQTSFQVQVARPGRASYGENPACPHCHPAYLKPGTCEPCIVKR